MNFMEWKTNKYFNNLLGGGGEEGRIVHPFQMTRRLEGKLNI
jgi:hypothetical protein